MNNLEAIKTQSPSFPEISRNTLLDIKDEQLWQVLCGDKGHWRTGIYSPEADSIDAVNKLEKHNCPELFLLLSGEISIVVKKNNKLEIIKLEPLRPILVDTWHNGFCPNGKHTGMALVVERDEFTTQYQSKL